MRGRSYWAAWLLLLLVCLCMVSCGEKTSLSGLEAENNTGDKKDIYPYVVHTPSAVWYLAADDIKMLGEEAFYAGLEQILLNQEADFADAREALAGFLPEEVPPVDIYTDFCGKAEISGWAGAYYNQVSGFIKVFSGWESAESTLLHEYVHYLTMGCMEKPASEGFFSEGIAEYISKIACKNRCARSVNLGLSEEEAAFYREQGAFDEAEDCIDPRLFYFGMAQIMAEGGLVGTEYFTVSDVTAVRTEDIQEDPDAKTVSHIEAACIMAYLADTYSEETVFGNLCIRPEEMEKVFGEPFSEIYKNWVVWNKGKCRELGIMN